MIPKLDDPCRAIYDEIVAEVHRLDDLCYYSRVGVCKQFTNDFTSEYLPNTVVENRGWPCNLSQFEENVGALHYVVDNICEVMDKTLPDYQLFSELETKLRGWEEGLKRLKEERGSEFLEG